MENSKLLEIIKLQSEIIKRLVRKQINLDTTPTHLAPEKQELQDLQKELEEKLKHI
jgi:peptidoglycan hydrolase CwlO-like protein